MKAALRAVARGPGARAMGGVARGEGEREGGGGCMVGYVRVGVGLEGWVAGGGDYEVR